MKLSCSQLTHNVIQVLVGLPRSNNVGTVEVHKCVKCQAYMPAPEQYTT